MSDSIRAEELAVVYLAGVPAEVLERLAARARLRSYSGGEPIFSEGDDGASLYVVRSGKVKIVTYEESGAERIHQRYGPGGVFGELAMFDVAPRSAGAIAEADSVTIELDKADFDEIVGEPVLLRRMIGLVARQRTREKDEAIADLYESRLEAVQTLAEAAEYFDKDTGLHIVRMSEYCKRLGQACGMSQAEAQLLLSASKLHDIGKLAIPKELVQTERRYTPEDMEIMKGHTRSGERLLRNKESELLRLGSQVALTHHEKWDGTGYPRGLQRDEIPLIGRICAVSDVFDALTSKRPYKDPMPVDEALSLIHEGMGHHFDPDLVTLFDDVLPDILALKEQYSPTEPDDGP